MKNLLALAAVFGIICYSALTWGYVTSITYRWFILPTFPTFPHLGYLEFIGIIMFLSCLFHRSPLNIKKEFKDEEMEMVIPFIIPWVTLLMCWVVKIVFF